MRGARKQRKRTVYAVLEMGFPTSSNGTSTGNGQPTSSTGKLRILGLTPIPAARGLEKLFSALLERFLKPIPALPMYCKN
jgi:hypothetical protein